MINIKGYDKLSDYAKEIFESTYKIHKANNPSYTAIKVTEHKDHLKVYFNNGEWLHYYSNGTWG